ncbi:DUF829 domain-containing protein [Campylobacter sp. US33a]|uniref:DUF829 domain-containing protein n=1 Tax=Campylobacter sp. US33a TaxID=2498120 RepID=UPI001068CAE1|nr:DUF829 domain-containing protein [Campylobacter sp. US33a]TEY04660.1 DUF829 domain-containing protein [Campylobacter sp. US33a]
MTRDTFYIAGYDPRGYRHYFSMFKKNINEQNKISSFTYQTSKAEIKKYPTWKISTPNSNTTYTFLAWNDVVKKNWSENLLDALKDWWSFFRIYTITGLFIKFGKESIYQLITGYYPFFYVLFSFLLTFFISAFGFYGVRFLMDFNSLSLIFASFIFIALFYFSIKILFEFGKKIGAFWISRICSFCANWEKRRQGVLDLRMNEFADTIFNTLKNNQNTKNYELILCAHSVGTILCVKVLALLVKKCLKENVKFHSLKVLTLGECIPLVSYQKISENFRQDLKFLIKQDKILWYDFGSIIDGACFAGVDFIKTSGVKEDKIFTYPKFLSPKFHTLYKKENYKKIKRNKYQAHFLYLFANEIKGDYDFFDFVAGEKMLEEKIK